MCRSWLVFPELSLPSGEVYLVQRAEPGTDVRERCELEEVRVWVWLGWSFLDGDGCHACDLASHVRIERGEQTDAVPVDEDDVFSMKYDTVGFELSADSRNVSAVRADLVGDELLRGTESVLTLGVELEQPELAFAHVHRTSAEKA